MVEVWCAVCGGGGGGSGSGGVVEYLQWLVGKLKTNRCSSDIIYTE